EQIVHRIGAVEVQRGNRRGVLDDVYRQRRVLEDDRGAVIRERRSVVESGRGPHTTSRYDNERERKERDDLHRSSLTSPHRTRRTASQWAQLRGAVVATHQLNLIERQSSSSTRIQRGVIPCTARG